MGAADAVYQEQPDPRLKFGEKEMGKARGSPSPRMAFCWAGKYSQRGAGVGGRQGSPGRSIITVLQG